MLKEHVLETGVYTKIWFENQMCRRHYRKQAYVFAWNDDEP